VFVVVGVVGVVGESGGGIVFVVVGWRNRV
jgi:hypothetical protein